MKREAEKKSDGELGCQVLLGLFCNTVGSNPKQEGKCKKKGVNGKTRVIVL